jgi:hypothetical protein
MTPDLYRSSIMTPETPTDSPKTLTPEAQRALEEAKQRRLAGEQHQIANEHDGPTGQEPTRFGDWERKGIAYDF